MKINLTRKSDDSVVIDESVKLKVQKEFPGTKLTFKVTPSVGKSADAQFTEKVKDLQFDKKISVNEAITEMARREPTLFRMARAPIADPEYADIGCQS